MQSKVVNYALSNILVQFYHIMSVQNNIYSSFCGDGWVAVLSSFESFISPSPEPQQHSFRRERMLKAKWEMGS